METQHLLSRTSLTITFQQAGNHRLVDDVSTGFFWLEVLQKLQQEIFIFTCKKYHTQSSSLHAALFHVCLFGVASLRMWQHGPRPSLPAEQDPASHQDEASLHPHPPAPLHIHTSTLIWWECYNLEIIVIIFSQSLIVHLNGWKLFPLPPLPS
jgi:hypothetical protein